MALGVAVSIQVGKVPAALTTLAAEFDRPLAGAALLVSLFALMSAVAGLPLGLLAGRLGARRALLLGAAIATLAAAAGAAAPGFNSLLAARVFEGLGFLLIVSAAPGIIAALVAPGQRNVAMALWGAYMPLGAALGLASALIVQQGGWRMAWWLATAALAIAGLATAASLRGVAGLPSRGLGLREALAAVARNRAAQAIALTFASYNGVYFAISVLLPAALAQSFDWSVAAGGYAGAAAVLANGVGNLAAGWLFHRGVAPARLLRPALVGLAALGAGCWLAPSALSMVALACGACLAGGMIPAALFAILPAAMPPALTPAAMGLLIQANNIVQLTVPLAMAALAAFGWPWLAPCMLGFALLAGSRRAGSPPETQPCRRITCGYITASPCPYMKASSSSVITSGVRPCRAELLDDDVALHLAHQHAGAVIGFRHIPPQYSEAVPTHDDAVRALDELLDRRDILLDVDARRQIVRRLLHQVAIGQAEAADFLESRGRKAMVSS